jgi:bacteriocin-like protein
MKKQLNFEGKLSLKNELSKNDLKKVTGGTQQTYCDGAGPVGPFPVSQQPIGCAPGYCYPSGHGHFLYCA